MADSTPIAAPNEPETEIEIPPPQKSRKGIIVIVVAVLALIALGIWWHSTYSEDTDDAQVNGHLIQVSSRINGQVLKVDVEENQVVNAGDTIAELDPATCVQPEPTSAARRPAWGRRRSNLTPRTPK